MSHHNAEKSQALIIRCRNGEKEAYAELYGLYAKAMLNVSFRILNNKEEAEDVLQESFLSAFRNLQNFDGKFSFGVWLKRIVINRSLDMLKKKKLDLIPLQDHDFPEEDAEEIIEYDVDAIKNSLLQLPDGYRTILTLYLFENLSHKEIAEAQEITEGTSKSQYHRARKKLIELIQKNTITNDR